MDCVLQMMDFVLKMMDLHRQRSISGRRIGVCELDLVCSPIGNEDSFIGLLKTADSQVTFRGDVPRTVHHAPRR